jgi:hypothetical protein
MLRGEFESAGASTPAELRTAYEELLGEVVDRIGAETVAEGSGADAETVEALAAGESPEVTLETAAAILAAEDGRPDAETIEMEALDILLMGMTTAVLDVEAVAAGIDDEMEPKEIQQKIEGRYPITLGEYARLHAFIAGER